MADLEVDVGVKATLDIILSAGPKDTGRFRTIHVPGWENVKGPVRLICAVVVDKTDYSNRTSMMAKTNLGSSLLSSAVKDASLAATPA